LACILLGANGGLKLLRIQKETNGEVVVTLSGRMDEESTAELETLIRAEASGRPVVLDLKNLILAGQDAIEFLARCEAADVRLVHCAPYIREWITRQKNGT
jgi:anti-anti-sigma regulatory factor